MNKEQQLLTKSLHAAYSAGKEKGFLQATILYALLATAAYLVTLV